MAHHIKTPPVSSHLLWNRNLGEINLGIMTASLTGRVSDGGWGNSSIHKILGLQSLIFRTHVLFCFV